MKEVEVPKNMIVMNMALRNYMNEFKTKKYQRKYNSNTKYEKNTKKDAKVEEAAKQ